MLIEHWQYKQKQLLRSDPEFGPAYDDSPLFSEQQASSDSNRKSLLFSLRSPWLFIIFGGVLGLLGLATTVVGEDMRQSTSQALRVDCP